MTQRKRFEITLFWNEVTLFKERIQNTLAYVDSVYIAEGNESLSGKFRRDFQLPSLISMLSEDVQKRVIPVLFDFSKVSESNPLVRERLLRDAALKSLLLNPNFKEDSLLIIQDFDEFLCPDRILELENELFSWRFWEQSLRIRQRLSYYQLNLQDPSDWSLALAVKGRLARTLGFSPNEWRHQKAKRKSRLTRSYFGWHHSYLGDLKFIRHKLDAFADSGVEWVRSVTDDQITQALKQGADLFGRGIPFRKINYSEVDPIPVLRDRVDLMGG